MEMSEGIPHWESCGNPIALRSPCSPACEPFASPSGALGRVLGQVLDTVKGRADVTRALQGRGGDEEDFTSSPGTLIKDVGLGSRPRRAAEVCGGSRGSCTSHMATKPQ